MCGRFTLTPMDAQSIADGLGVPVESLKLYRPRYNIAPTDEHFIVRVKYESRELLPARWGLINSWAKDAKEAFKQINARAETIDARPPFREAFRHRRCVVPADGFFEWSGAKDARRPTWFHRPGGQLILFAGLHESWQPKPGEWERTFTIVTTHSNRLVAALHDRMPVILSQEAADEWLNPRQEDWQHLKRLLVPPAEELLVARPVSPKLNSPKYDSAELLEEEPQLRL